MFENAYDNLNSILSFAKLIAVIFYMLGFAFKM